MKSESQGQTYSNSIQRNLQVYSSHNIMMKIFAYVRVFIALSIVCCSFLWQRIFDLTMRRLSYPRRVAGLILNLVLTRLALLTLGFWRFQCQNFRFFNQSAAKIYLGSGNIGIAPYRNIISYLYLSYLFNPTFIRIIIRPRSQKNEEEIFYVPFTFWDSPLQLLDLGFPLHEVPANQNQYRNYPQRKLSLSSILGESRQQIQGPVIFLLENFSQKYLSKVPFKMAQTICRNQNNNRKYAILFNIRFEGVSSTQKIYPNQLDYLLQICSSFNPSRLTVSQISTQYFYMRGSNQWLKEWEINTQKFYNKNYQLQYKFEGFREPKRIGFDQFLKRLQKSKYLDHKFQKELQKILMHERLDSGSFINAVLPQQRQIQSDFQDVSDQQDVDFR